MSSEEIGIETARKNLGPIVHRVQHGGAEIILTRNGKPAARIVPIPQETSMAEYYMPLTADQLTAGMRVIDCNGVEAKITEAAPVGERFSITVDTDDWAWANPMTLPATETVDVLRADVPKGVSAAGTGGYRK